MNLLKKLHSVFLHFKNDSLYRNSIYLMASTVVLAVSGFFFWVVAARLFKTEQVGIATTLISITTLISSFALLGLNISLVRFLPRSEKKNEMISTSFILVILASIITTVVFLIGVNSFSPHLSFIRSSFIYLIIFALFIILSSVSNVLDSIFLAYRASENILIRTTLLSVIKVVLIFFFLGMGAFGIFNSFAFAVIISSGISFVILMKKFNFHPIMKIDTDLVKKLGSFSIANYISGFLYQAPLLILPIVIINSLHATAAAYYYIDSMILGLLIVVPVAASQSLLTEGSHDESLLFVHLRKAVKITVLLLLPSLLAVLLFGGFVLQFFGKSYEADAFKFLQIISLSSIFMSVVLFGNAILRIRKKNKALIVLNGIGCVAILASSYALISYNLVGVGLGWLIGQMIIAGIYLIYFFKSR